MTTHNDDTPRKRSIELEVEVPGTPEQVWEAIATGPGITAWFVPTELEGREGGTLSLDMMGKGMEESGVVTSWDPPRRFVYEEKWEPSEGASAARLATEWLVEARSGGTCVVRLVNSLFASGEDWDDQLEDMREGWGAYLHNLRLYLTNFPGERCSTILVTGNASGSKAEAWSELTGALGLADVGEGERIGTHAADAPTLAGTVERVAESKHHRELMLRLDEPAPGVAFVFAFEYLAQVYTSVHAYLFGPEAEAVAARDEPAWRTWMEDRFPSAEEVSETGAKRADGGRQRGGRLSGTASSGTASSGTASSGTASSGSGAGRSRAS
jgi:uncharacterized protein YndB with AHSA1/START domain